MLVAAGQLTRRHSWLLPAVAEYGINVPRGLETIPCCPDQEGARDQVQGTPAEVRQPRRPLTCPPSKVTAVSHSLVFSALRTSLKRAQG
jgi:hypothetical protein